MEYVTRNLIDQDDLIDSLDISDWDIWAKGVIREAPLINAVEVIRCKDCKHFEPNEIITASSGTCWYCEMVRMFDDFCSRGELKR